MKCENATLVRMISVNNKVHIVWMDYSALEKGVISIVRAFYEKQDEFEKDLGEVRAIERIKPDSDIFCYNGSAYYLYQTMSGNHCIRRLRAYCSQTVVEQIERQSYEDKTVESIFLSNFYLLDGNERKYALTCWGITYDDGSNSYLPVFDEDKHYVEEYLLAAFVREEVPVGGIFKNNGWYYKLMKDSSGKLYLAGSKMVFALNKDTAEKDKPLCFETAKVLTLKT